ncbi:MAG: hypothetical protein R2771_04585 [Saprospiraceae bacterium]
MGYYNQHSANTSYSMTNLSSNSSFEFTVEAISDCACGNISVTKGCSTEPCPFVELAISGLPDQICKSDVAQTLSLNADITGTTGGDVAWSGTGISQNGQLNLTNFEAGNYVYTVDYTLDNCSYSVQDSVLITDNPLIVAESHDPLCNGESNGEISISPENNVSYTVNGQSSSRSLY